LTKNLKLSLALITIALVALVVALLVAGNDPVSEQAATDDNPDTAQLVREDSPRLSEGGDAVFVEFLDFECEACIALYPTVEDLREQYGDRVTFVVRHMPLHDNSMAAALAAEAAAEQGQFEAMYSRLFETPEQWGHQQTPQRDTFFGYAEDLGLDMDRFERAYNDPATLSRIEQSKQDGQRLGVTGTPTFFLDGERLDPTSVTDLENSINAALE